MIKLYCMAGSCSLASHISLIWADVPHYIEMVTYEDLFKPDFVAKNPNSAVPLLVDGDWVVTQNAAILPYIARLNESKHLGAKWEDPKATANFYQALGYLNSDFHTAFMGIFAPAVLGFDKKDNETAYNAAKNRIEGHLEQLEKHFADHQYFFSDHKTVCDAYLGVMLRWIAHTIKGELDNYPNTNAYFQRFLDDPAVQQAMKEEGLDK